VQTDVPDRDERLPWRMDGYHNSLYFLNSTPFFERNIFESTISPCPEGERPGQVPRALNMYCKLSRADAKQPLFYYRLTGNDAPLRQNYGFLRNYMMELEKQFPDGICSIIGTPDWLNADMIDAPGIPETGAQIGWDEYSTFDYAESVKMFAEMAEILGEEEDVKLFNSRLNVIKNSISQKLLSADRKTRSDTQTSYALLLFFDLVAKEDIPAIVRHYYDAIKRYNNRLSCGVYNIDEVLSTLTMLGDHDLAINLAFEPRFPSLGYMIDQGATSLWERWDTYLHTRPDVHEKLRWQAPKGSCLTFINEAGCAGVSMNSFNHLEMSSSSRFVIERMLGLRLGTAPAASKMQAVVPTGGSIREASGKYLTARGLSALHWKKEDGKIAVELTVPLGCTTTLSVPCQTLTDLDSNAVFTLADNRADLPNASVLTQSELSDKITITLPSGTYRFKGE
jgi:alpha-L-rhamnosidase